MTLVAVASAKGAPGVTTLAVALAALAPRAAVLAELDPAGGDVALRYRTTDDHPLDADRGLLSWGAAARRDPTTPVTPHLQEVSGGLEVLVGAGSPEQTTALGPVWPLIGRLLRDLPERDVVADCGRVAVSSATLPVLQAADVVVMVARDTVESIAHLRERLRTLEVVLPDAAALAVVLVAGERQRGAVDDTRQLLAAGGLNVPVLGAIADDPKGARQLRGIGAGSAGRSALVRSVRSVLPPLHALLDQRARLTRERA